MQTKQVLALLLFVILFLGFSGCTQLLDSLSGANKNKNNKTMGINKSVSGSEEPDEIPVNPNNGNSPPPLPDEITDNSNNAPDSDSQNNDFPLPPPG